LYLTLLIYSLYTSLLSYLNNLNPKPFYNSKIIPLNLSMFPLYYNNRLIFFPPTIYPHIFYFLPNNINLLFHLSQILTLNQYSLINLSNNNIHKIPINYSFSQKIPNLNYTPHFPLSKIRPKLKTPTLIPPSLQLLFISYIHFL
jgi:hypothetical protein